jgi:hypothetical protein
MARCWARSTNSQIWAGRVESAPEVVRTVTPIVLSVLVILVSSSGITLNAHAAPVESGVNQSSISSDAAAFIATAGYRTIADVRNQTHFLTLHDPGLLNIFGMANGGEGKSTGFNNGNIVTGVDQAGHIAAAIGATQAGSDYYGTSDSSYSIGGVGISGFQYYGVKTSAKAPPDNQKEGKLTLQVVLPETALVVVIALSGGQDVVELGGIPGLIRDAKGSGPGWEGIMIGQAVLESGTYSVTEHSTSANGSTPDRSDVLGLFAFSNVSAGFIDQSPPIRVVSTVTGGGLYNSVDLAYDNQKGEIFAATCAGDCGDSNVTVVSDETDAVVATVETPGFPGAIAYDSSKGEIFVSSYGVGVSVISDKSNTVIATITSNTFASPGGMAYDPTTGEIFYFNYNSNNVGVISDATNTVVLNVPVAEGIEDIAYDSVAREVWVAYDGGASAISDVTDRVVANVAIPSQAFGIACDAPLGEVYVEMEGEVAVISESTDRLVKIIPTYGANGGATDDAVQGLVFFGGGGANNLSVVSAATNRLIATIPTNGYLAGWDEQLVYDSGAKEIFAINESTIPGLNGLAVIAVGNPL